MLKPENVKKVIQLLEKEFPDPKPPLNFTNRFELMVAVVLSGQSTDEQVNKVTPNLFPEYNSPKKLLQLGEEKLREIIYSCGYHNQKAKNLIATSKILLEKYDGKIPNTLERLTALPGIGRKTASVILIHGFNTPAFPVDTHVIRLANRIGLVHEKTPDKTDLALRKRIPKEKWIDMHLHLIFHGRKTCQAKKPHCWECPLKDICEWPDKVLQSNSK